MKAVWLGLLLGVGAAAQVLQPLASKAGPAPMSLGTGAAYYVPVTAQTNRWGYLPAADAMPVLTVPSGAVVTFDTVSHEGMLEDQGRDPAKFFARFGVPRAEVLDDAEAIATSAAAHDFAKDGPHIVVGPVALEGAEPGDVLKVEYLALTPRVSYGVVSNRHGKGALPGEFPEGAAPDANANQTRPESFRNVSTFVRLHGGVAEMKLANGGSVHFPAAPFLGTAGVTPAAQQATNSIPPGDFGGNLDIRNLVAGSTLYLPVQVRGAGFFVADPHFAQGNGEVALTAVEGSLRATMRLTVIKQGTPAAPMKSVLTGPFAETPQYWICIGLDADLNEAMKKAVRAAVSYLAENHGMDRATALAYLSAAADFDVSQVVDRVKGVHVLIRKQDFAPARTAGGAQAGH